MKTYRVQLWSGIDPDQLSACAQYIYLTCKQELRYGGTLFCGVHLTDIKTWAFKSIYITISDFDQEIGEYRINTIITSKLNAYKRMTGQNGIMIDSIHEII